MKKFKLEMTEGQTQRHVEADSFHFLDDWLIFYRKPATGGSIEYWRVQLRYVICMESLS